MHIYKKKFTLEEFIVSSLIISIIFSSSIALLFSLITFNGTIQYMVLIFSITFILHIFKKSTLSNYKNYLLLHFDELINKYLTWKSILVFTLILLPVLYMLRPTNEGDSLSALSFMISWSQNFTTPYSFLAGFPAFWHLSYVPSIVIVGGDIFFWLTSFKSIFLICGVSYLLGRELRLPGRLCWLISISGILFVTFWTYNSGMGTLKDDAIFSVGILLLALSLLKFVNKNFSLFGKLCLVFSIVFLLQKYPGLGILMPFLIFFILFGIRKGIRIKQNLKWIFVSFVIIFVTTGHYYAENYITYGNPLYPHTHEIQFSSNHELSNELLLEIWNDRSDLQSTQGYPEVADGDFTRMKIWAEDIGWNEDERLSDFIPEGETPIYIISEPLYFPISNELLLEIWNDRSDLHESDYYAEIDDESYATMTLWAIEIGWNYDERLSDLIPAGQIPSYLPQFPISDDVLFQIWSERVDLRTAFPEVAENNFKNIRDWAENYGWNEDTRLIILIPDDEVPEYVKHSVVYATYGVSLGNSIFSSISDPELYEKLLLRFDKFTQTGFLFPITLIFGVLGTLSILCVSLIRYFLTKKIDIPTTFLSAFILYCWAVFAITPYSAHSMLGDFFYIESFNSFRYAEGTLILTELFFIFILWRLNLPKPILISIIGINFGSRLYFLYHFFGFKTIDPILTVPFLLPLLFFVGLFIFKHVKIKIIYKLLVFSIVGFTAIFFAPYIVEDNRDNWLLYWSDIISEIYYMDSANITQVHAGPLIAPNAVVTSALYGYQSQHSLDFRSEESLLWLLEKSSNSDTFSYVTPDYVIRLCYPGANCIEYIDKMVPKLEEYGYKTKILIDDGILMKLED